MKNMFRPDSPIMCFLTQAAELAWLNILWFLCCIPVVTIGASTAALCRTVSNMVRQSGQWGTRAFFRAFRQNFKGATFLWLILLATLAVIAADVYILSSMYAGQIFWLILPCVCGFVWLCVSIWGFPLTALFENSLGGTLKNAILLATGYLPRTLLMIVMHLLPFILCILSPERFYTYGILWLVLLTAVTRYTDALLLRKPFAPFFPEESAEEE